MKNMLYSAALFSSDGRYRYSLSRIWDPSKPQTCWILLNPSKANAQRDDATARRVMGFARRWGYGGFIIVNKQLPGPDFGVPVIVTVEGMPAQELASLLIGCAKKLMEESDKQHGFDCREVAEVYDQDADGSAQEVLARTGCLSCPVASRDLVLERTVRKPEWAYLAPLLELRPLFEQLSTPQNRLQKNGERKADGTLSSRPMRLGPLTMEARKKGLGIVMAIQRSVNKSAHDQGRPQLSLINGEEFSRILDLIDANTWPDKWDGTEPAGDELLPQIRRDGFTLPLLFGGN